MGSRIYLKIIGILIWFGWYKKVSSTLVRYSGGCIGLI